MAKGPLLLLLTCAAAAFAPPATAEEERTAFQKQAALFVQHCAKCHTVGQGNRVGPDLRGATERREREWLLGFIAGPSLYLDSDPTAQDLLKEFAGVRMPDLGITPDQAEQLVEFIDTMSRGPAGGPGAFVPLVKEQPATRVTGPDENFGLSWGGLAVAAGLLALGVLLFRAGVPTAAQIALVLALGAGYWSFGGRRYHALFGDDQGYAPTQPMTFSHARHAGELSISCLYCHAGAEKGPVAGVPAVSTCMNCHEVVRQRRDQTEPSPEIAKLIAVWETRDDAVPRTLEWVRVHRLPDFVTFNHQVHVRNAIQCQECHGPVETMDRLRQASNLAMGWCLQCHRHQGKAAPTHWKRSQATLDCAACHQ